MSSHCICLSLSSFFLKSQVPSREREKRVGYSCPCLPLPHPLFPAAGISWRSAVFWRAHIPRHCGETGLGVLSVFLWFWVYRILHTVCGGQGQGISPAKWLEVEQGQGRPCGCKIGEVPGRKWTYLARPIKEGNRQKGSRAKELFFFCLLLDVSSLFCSSFGVHESCREQSCLALGTFGEFIDLDGFLGQGELGFSHLHLALWWVCAQDKQEERASFQRILFSLPFHHPSHPHWKDH